MINGTLFELNSTYACPICGGVIKQAHSDSLILRCHDCNNIFEAISEGHVDSTSIYQLVYVGTGARAAM